MSEHMSGHSIHRYTLAISQSLLAISEASRSGCHWEAVLHVHEGRCVHRLQLGWMLVYLQWAEFHRIFKMMAQLWSFSWVSWLITVITVMIPIVSSDPKLFWRKRGIRVIQAALIRCWATRGFAGESGVGRVSAWQAWIFSTWRHHPVDEVSHGTSMFTSNRKVSQDCRATVAVRVTWNCLLMELNWFTQTERENDYLKRSWRFMKF